MTEPYYVSENSQGWAVFRTEDHREVSRKPMSHEDAVVLCERLRLEAVESRWRLPTYSELH